MISRVAGTIASWGRERGYFASDQDADTFEAELALDFLDRLTRLVRNETREGRPDESVLRHSVSEPDFFRQKKSAPPIVAKIVAIADLFRPPCSPVPGTAAFAFWRATRFPIFRTPQPTTALRRFMIPIAISFPVRSVAILGRARVGTSQRRSRAKKVRS